MTAGSRRSSPGSAAPAAPGRADPAAGHGPSPSGKTSLSPRTVSRIETGSRCRRRKQNSSTRAEGTSSHCASSTVIISGAARESIRSESRIPRASTRGSGSGRPASGRSADAGPGTPSRRSAASTARLCGLGSAGRTSSATSPNRSSSAEKARGLSTGSGRQDSTLDERPAAWSTCCHTMLLPIPASPVMASAAGAPDAAERNALTSATSASRPTSSDPTISPRIPCDPPQITPWNPIQILVD